MEWGGFSDRYPRAHLVSGEYDPREKWSRTSRLGMLARLVVSLAPTGAWAVNKMVRQRATFIYIAYEIPSDAVKLRRAVRAIKAAPASHRDRWISHYEFWLNRAMHDEIVRMLESRDGVAEVDSAPIALATHRG